MVFLSGHIAVLIGKSEVVVFGGLLDKKFLSDITVYDIGKLEFFCLNFSFSFFVSFVGFVLWSLLKGFLNFASLVFLVRQY